MIVDCISDFHGFYPKLEGGDLLIIAGDLTARDRFEEHADFLGWLNLQPYRKKIFISGNHDNLSYPQFDWDDSISYLLDSGVEFEGLKIWGSPWTAQFKGINPKCCAFTMPFGCDTEEHLADRWELIPNDVDILITHSPPHGILDGIPCEDGSDFHVGSKSLLNELENRIKPKLHVFGHIHENGGRELIYKRPGYGTENNTICVNSSHVNENYKPVNKPIRVIL